MCDMDGRNTKSTEGELLPEPRTGTQVKKKGKKSCPPKVPVEPITGPHPQGKD